MTDEAQKENEFKYHEILNISVLSIAKIKQLIKTDIIRTFKTWASGRNVKKQCWHIIGPAGVGKTEICSQISSELSAELGPALSGIKIEKPELMPSMFLKGGENFKFDMLMIKGPVLSRDDFIIPFPVIREGENSFKMLYSDFVPKGKGTCGIFVIDEFSRADHSLQQLLWQVQNEYAIHRYPFPKGWFVISIDNPDDAEYQMDNLEDAAGLRRQLHIYTEVSPVDFLDYAIAQNFHPFVIEFIQTHPERIYDFQSQKLGAVYANPASWERISDHLWKMESNGGIDFNSIEHIGAGLLNVNMTQMFIDFARDKKDINPRDVFYNFDKVKKDVQKLKDTGDNGKLGELMVGYCTFMTTTRPKYQEQQLKNIEEFLLMMPIDTAALFISQIDGFDRNSEAFKYMTDIHVALLRRSKRYKKEFYDPIVDCGDGKLNVQRAK
jgi:hypothetical protein